MSVHIDWQQQFLLGLAQVDDQHHHFAMLINRLSDEFAQSDNRPYLDGLLRELAAYARFHFISEENLMLRADYPHHRAHQQQHMQLIDALSGKMGLVSLEPTRERVDALLQFLLDWFLHHTAMDDRRFADYLSGRT